jgi:hypothetical protein
MAEHDYEPIPSEDHAAHQDWGFVLGIGIVVLAVLVMVINLFSHRDPIIFARPYKQVSVAPAWVLVGRWIGLMVCLGGGGLFLWRLLGQRQRSEQSGLKSFLPTQDSSSAPEGVTRRAYLLLGEVEDTLKKSPITSEKKVLLMKQAAEIPDNVVQVTGKLEQLRRISRLAKSDGDVQREALDLEAQLHAAAEDSVELLASVPLSLIRLELAHRDTGIDGIVAGLRESNRRMRDLAEAYDEVRLGSWG